MGALIRRILQSLLKGKKPPARPGAAGNRANQSGNGSRRRDECVGDCKESGSQQKRANDPIKDKEKLERQMQQRGWTYEQIEEAVKTGKSYPARNFQTGGPATRYVHPQTGRSVIIDDATGGIIQVGGDGFKF
ncbi:MAG: colicin E5-related ribonuclease [Tropicimonas sp.]|uniref:colicin E5-related ribonuclease n=1 Tax=Tropicimonas sp. TaxID=2067044 RepID=UPI003A839E68